MIWGEYQSLIAFQFCGSGWNRYNSRANISHWNGVMAKRRRTNMCKWSLVIVTHNGSVCFCHGHVKPLLQCLLVTLTPERFNVFAVEKVTHRY